MITDAPPAKKVTIYVQAEQCRDEALGEKLEETKPEGIRMIRDAFGYFNPWTLFGRELFALGLDVREFFLLILSTGVLILVGSKQERGARLQAWFLRQHHKVQSLPFRPDIKRPDRDNVIDAYINKNEEDCCSNHCNNPLHFYGHICL